MPLQRYLHSTIEADLAERMVFIGGPRQVGKTTLALGFLDPPSVGHPGYLTWDRASDRATLLRSELPGSEPVVVLDELHKYARWRGLLKGFHDTTRGTRRFLVTGSARLDHYSRGGDSLQGRYQHYRLHPLSLPELDRAAGPADVEALLRFGGFPEPLLRGEERFWRRWQLARGERVIQDDVRDLENVKEISLLELLAQDLPRRVGAPLSVAGVARALQVSHETADRWIRIFEQLYVCFRIPPYGAPRVRAVRKEQKLYLWDWSLVDDPGPRFENMVASHLLKLCHHQQDTEGWRMELRFLRDTDGREVDFVVLREGEPVLAVECKSGARDPNPAFRYFLERTTIPRAFQVHLGSADFERQGVRVLPFARFCAEVGLV